MLKKLAEVTFKQKVHPPCLLYLGKNSTHSIYSSHHIYSGTSKSSIAQAQAELSPSIKVSISGTCFHYFPPLLLFLLVDILRPSLTTSVKHPGPFLGVNSCNNCTQTPTLFSNYFGILYIFARIFEHFVLFCPF